MSIRTVNNGAAKNAFPRDDIRTAFGKVNENFAQWFNDYAALAADTRTYTDPADADDFGFLASGDILRTRKEGFSYEVAASDATDHHLTTAGGAKLYVRGDEVTPAMLGCVTWAAAVAAGTEAASATANKPKIAALFEYAAASRTPLRFDDIYICAPEITLDWDGEDYLRLFLDVSGSGGGGLAFYAESSFTHALKIIGGNGDQIISASNIYIHDMLISQGVGSSGRRAQAGDGLVLTSMFHIYGDRVNIEGFDGRGLYGQGLWDSEFRDFKVQHCGNEAGKKASVAFHDFAGAGGNQNTNSCTLEGFQVEHSYWHLYEIGGDLVIAGNGGGAQNFDLINCKAHRRSTGETLLLNGLIDNGTPRVNGGGQTGTTLIVDGLDRAPLVHEVLTVGGNDYIVTAVSYASGEATLTLGSSLSGSPSDNALVTFTREPLVAGGGQTGTNLQIDGLVLTPAAGDRIWIAGLDGSYVVDSVSSYNASAGTATLVLTTSLAASPADNASVEFYSRFKANFRIFGAESSDNRILSAQISPQERFGALIDSGASDTMVSLSSFGGANPGRQPIYIRDDAGAGSMFIGLDFDDKPSLAADMIRDDSANSHYAAGFKLPSGVTDVQISNKHGTTGLLGEYGGRYTVYTEGEIPLIVRDMRAPAVDNAFYPWTHRNNANNDVSEFEIKYVGGSTSVEAMLRGLKSGTLSDFISANGHFNVVRFHLAETRVLGRLRLNGHLLTADSTTNTNTPSGATAHQLAIYDETDTLLGYIPIYGAAW